MDNPNEDTVDLSCILTLKKNHIIAYSWRGHDSTVIPSWEGIHNEVIVYLKIKNVL